MFTSSLAAIGLDDLEKAGLTIFPNPVDDYLVLHVPNFLSVSTISIVSVDGKTSMVEQSAQGETITLNTGKLAAGTYFLHVSTTAGNAVYQFVVHH